MTKKQKTDVILTICNSFIEAVKVGGSQGVPAGHMYAAVMGQMSLNDFQTIMDVLVSRGFVRKTGDVYYHLKDFPS